MRGSNARIAATLAGVALLGAGLLVASNQGFLVSYELLGPGDSASGTNWVGLPYQTRASLQTAADLYDDLGGAADVTSVARYDAVSGALEVYDGNAQDDFNLVPGEGIRIIMATTKTYQIFGSHDPAHVVALLGPADSFDGGNWYSHPYNAKSSVVGQLRDEIGQTNVSTILQHLRATDNLLAYSGAPTDQNFTLVAGEAYKLEMTQTLQFVPATLP